MTQRKLDKLLKELYSEENKQMLQDIKITPMDEMMKRVEKTYPQEQLQEKAERIKRLERRRLFRQQMLRSAAIACTILVISAIFSGFFNSNPVKAWQMNLKTTIIVIKDGIRSVFTPDANENPPSGKVEIPKLGIITSSDVQSISPDQVKNDLPFKVPMPEYIPEGFEFDAGTWEALDEIDSISLTYKTKDDPPLVLMYDIQTGYSDTKQNITASNPNTTVKEIQIGSRNVIIVSISEMITNAYWSDNQYMFSLGGNINEDIIIEMIKSLR